MGPESAINLAKPAEYVWAESMVLFQLNVMISRVFFKCAYKYEAR